MGDDGKLLGSRITLGTGGGWTETCFGGCLDGIAFVGGATAGRGCGGGAAGGCFSALKEAPRVGFGGGSFEDIDSLRTGTGGLVKFLELGRGFLKSCGPRLPDSPIAISAAASLVVLPVTERRCLGGGGRSGLECLLLSVLLS
mmetsp:Transcript_12927/g.20921  ORF Transcript_12927/g.20921 Transcript_12927/m.20921 type:complete len:143 (-) Transcript_12927:548-976(-)